MPTSRVSKILRGSKIRCAFTSGRANASSRNDGDQPLRLLEPRGLQGRGDELAGPGANRSGRLFVSLPDRQAVAGQDHERGSVEGHHLSAGPAHLTSRRVRGVIFATAKSLKLCQRAIRNSKELSLLGLVGGQLAMDVGRREGSCFSSVQTRSDGLQLAGRKSARARTPSTSPSACSGPFPRRRYRAG